jgi:hypothetical protein
MDPINIHLSGLEYMRSFAQPQILCRWIKYWKMRGWSEGSRVGSVYQEYPYQILIIGWAFFRPPRKPSAVPTQIECRNPKRWDESVVPTSLLSNHATKMFETKSAEPWKRPMFRACVEKPDQNRFVLIFLQFSEEYLDFQLKTGLMRPDLRFHGICESYSFFTLDSVVAKAFKYLDSILIGSHAGPWIVLGEITSRDKMHNWNLRSPLCPRFHCAINSWGGNLESQTEPLSFHLSKSCWHSEPVTEVKSLERNKRREVWFFLDQWKRQKENRMKDCSDIESAFLSQILIRFFLPDPVEEWRIIASSNFILR